MQDFISLFDDKEETVPGFNPTTKQDFDNLQKIKRYNEGQAMFDAFQDSHEQLLEYQKQARENPVLFKAQAEQRAFNEFGPEVGGLTKIEDIGHVERFAKSLVQHMVPLDLISWAGEKVGGEDNKFSGFIDASIERPKADTLGEKVVDIGAGTVGTVLGFFVPMGLASKAAGFIWKLSGVGKSATALGRVHRATTGLKAAQSVNKELIARGIIEKGEAISDLYKYMQGMKALSKFDKTLYHVVDQGMKNLMAFPLHSTLMADPERADLGSQIELWRHGAKDSTMFTALSTFTHLNKPAALASMVGAFAIGYGWTEEHKQIPNDERWIHGLAFAAIHGLGVYKEVTKAKDEMAKALESLAVPSAEKIAERTIRQVTSKENIGELEKSLEASGLKRPEIDKIINEANRVNGEYIAADAKRKAHREGVNLEYLTTEEGSLKYAQREYELAGRGNRRYSEATEAEKAEVLERAKEIRENGIEGTRESAEAIGKARQTVAERVEADKIAKETMEIEDRLRDAQGNVTSRDAIDSLADDLMRIVSGEAQTPERKASVKALADGLEQMFTSQTTRGAVKGKADALQKAANVPENYKKIVDFIIEKGREFRDKRAEEIERKFNLRDLIDPKSNETRAAAEEVWKVRNNRNEIPRAGEEGSAQAAKEIEAYQRLIPQIGIRNAIQPRADLRDQAGIDAMKRMKEEVAAEKKKAPEAESPAVQREITRTEYDDIIKERDRVAEDFRREIERDLIEEHNAKSEKKITDIESAPKALRDQLRSRVDKLFRETSDDNTPIEQAALQDVLRKYRIREESFPKKPPARTAEELLNDTLSSIAEKEFIRVERDRAKANEGLIEALNKRLRQKEKEEAAIHEDSPNLNMLSIWFETGGRLAKPSEISKALSGVYSRNVGVEKMTSVQIGKAIRKLEEQGLVNVSRNNDRQVVHAELTSAGLEKILKARPERYIGKEFVNLGGMGNNAYTKRLELVRIEGSGENTTLFFRDIGLEGAAERARQFIIRGEVRDVAFQQGTLARHAAKALGRRPATTKEGIDKQLKEIRLRSEAEYKKIIKDARNEALEKSSQMDELAILKQLPKQERERIVQKADAAKERYLEGNRNEIEVNISEVSNGLVLRDGYEAARPYVPERSYIDKVTGALSRISDITPTRATEEMSVLSIILGAYNPEGISRSIKKPSARELADAKKRAGIVIESVDQLSSLSTLSGEIIYRAINMSAGAETTPLSRVYAATAAAEWAGRVGVPGARGRKSASSGGHSDAVYESAEVIRRGNRAVARYDSATKANYSKSSVDALESAVRDVVEKGFMPSSFRKNKWSQLSKASKISSEKGRADALLRIINDPNVGVMAMVSRIRSEKAKALDRNANPREREEALRWLGDAFSNEAKLFSQKFKSLGDEYAKMVKSGEIREPEVGKALFDSSITIGGARELASEFSKRFTNENERRLESLYSMRERAYGSERKEIENQIADLESGRIRKNIADEINKVIEVVRETEDIYEWNKFDATKSASSSVAQERFAYFIQGAIDDAVSKTIALAKERGHDVPDYINFWSPPRPGQKGYAFLGESIASVKEDVNQFITKRFSQRERTTSLQLMEENAGREQLLKRAREADEGGFVERAGEIDKDTLSLLDINNADAIAGATRALGEISSLAEGRWRPSSVVREEGTGQALGRARLYEGAELLERSLSEAGIPDARNIATQVYRVKSQKGSSTAADVTYSILKDIDNGLAMIEAKSREIAEKRAEGRDVKELEIDLGILREEVRSKVSERVSSEAPSVGKTSKAFDIFPDKERYEDILKDVSEHFINIAETPQSARNMMTWYLEAVSSVLNRRNPGARLNESREAVRESAIMEAKVELDLPLDRPLPKEHMNRAEAIALERINAVDSAIRDVTMSLYQQGVPADFFRAGGTRLVAHGTSVVPEKSNMLDLLRFKQEFSDQTVKEGRILETVEKRINGELARESDPAKIATLNYQLFKLRAMIQSKTMREFTDIMSSPELRGKMASKTVSDGVMEGTMALAKYSDLMVNSSIRGSVKRGLADSAAVQRAGVDKLELRDATRISSLDARDARAIAESIVKNNDVNSARAIAKATGYLVADGTRPGEAKVFSSILTHAVAIARKNKNQEIAGMASEARSFRSKIDVEVRESAKRAENTAPRSLFKEPLPGEVEGVLDRVVRPVGPERVPTLPRRVEPRTVRQANVRSAETRKRLESIERQIEDLKKIGPSLSRAKRRVSRVEEISRMDEAAKAELGEKIRQEVRDAEKAAGGKETSRLRRAREELESYDLATSREPQREIVRLEQRVEELVELQKNKAEREKRIRALEREAEVVKSEDPSAFERRRMEKVEEIDKQVSRILSEGRGSDIDDRRLDASIVREMVERRERILESRPKDQRTGFTELSDKDKADIRRESNERIRKMGIDPRKSFGRTAMKNTAVDVRRQIKELQSDVENPRLGDKRKMESRVRIAELEEQLKYIQDAIKDTFKAKGTGEFKGANLKPEKGGSESVFRPSARRVEDANEVVKVSRKKLAEVRKSRKGLDPSRDGWRIIEADARIAAAEAELSRAVAIRSREAADAKIEKIARARGENIPFGQDKAIVDAAIGRLMSSVTKEAMKRGADRSEFNALSEAISNRRVAEQEIIGARDVTKKATAQIEKFRKQESSRLQSVTPDVIDRQVSVEAKRLGAVKRGNLMKDGDSVTVTGKFGETRTTLDYSMQYAGEVRQVESGGKRRWEIRINPNKAGADTVWHEGSAGHIAWDFMNSAQRRALAKHYGVDPKGNPLKVEESVVSKLAEDFAIGKLSGEPRGYLSRQFSKIRAFINAITGGLLFNRSVAQDALRDVATGQLITGEARRNPYARYQPSQMSYKDFRLSTFNTAEWKKFREAFFDRQDKSDTSMRSFYDKFYNRPETNLKNETAEVQEIISKIPEKEWSNRKKIGNELAAINETPETLWGYVGLRDYFRKKMYPAQEVESKISNRSMKVMRSARRLIKEINPYRSEKVEDARGVEVKIERGERMFLGLGIGRQAGLHIPEVWDAISRNDHNALKRALEGLGDRGKADNMRKMIYSVAGVLEKAEDGALRHKKNPDGTVMLDPTFSRSYELRDVERSFSAEQIRNMLNSTSGKEKTYYDNVVRHIIDKEIEPEVSAAYRYNNNKTLDLAQDYFPITREWSPLADTAIRKNPQTLFENASREQIEYRSLQESAFLKNRSYSTAPIKVKNMNDVMVTHVRGAGRYAAFSAPVREMRNSLEGNAHIIIPRAGRGRFKAMKKALDRIEGNYEDPGVVGREFNKILNNFSTAVLGANPGVSLYQPASIFSYAREFGYPIVARAVAMRPTPEGRRIAKEIYKYSHTLTDRMERTGSYVDLFSEVAGRSIGRGMISSRTRLIETLMKPIELMDRLAVKTGVLAAYLEGKQRGLTGEALYKYAAERGTQATHSTQVSGLTIARSGLRSNPHPLYRSIAFMSGALNAGYNVVARDVNTLMTSGYSREAARNLMVSVSGLVMASTMVSGIKTLRDYIQSSEEDRRKDKSFVDNAFHNFAGSLAGYAPFSPIYVNKMMELVSRHIEKDETQARMYSAFGARNPYQIGWSEFQKLSRAYSKYDKAQMGFTLDNQGRKKKISVKRRRQMLEESRIEMARHGMRVAELFSGVSVTPALKIVEGIYNE